MRGCRGRCARLAEIRFCLSGAGVGLRGNSGPFPNIRVCGFALIVREGRDEKRLFVRKNQMILALSGRLFGKRQ